MGPVTGGEGGFLSGRGSAFRPPLQLTGGFRCEDAVLPFFRGLSMRMSAPFFGIPATTYWQGTVKCSCCHRILSAIRMGSFIGAARLSEIPEGGMKRVVAGGTRLLLARVRGQVYATDLLCPHLQADLSQGTLDGTILTCPLHNSQFDIRNGHVVRWTNLEGVVLAYATKARPPRPLKCYPVRVEGNEILVDTGPQSPGI